MKSTSPILRASVLLLLGLTLRAPAQELPQDLTAISPEDTLALQSLGRLYKFSSYVPGYPPLPPGILAGAVDDGSANSTNLFFSASVGAVFWDDRASLVLEMATEQAISGNLRSFQVQEQQEALGSQEPYATTDFYLEPVSVTNSLLNLILHGTTNGSTYLITSTEFLDPATNSVWLVEGTLQGGTNDATQFALGIALRTNNLFIRAEPCDECATTALPLAWQLSFFGVTGVPENGDWDSDSVDNLTEFLTGTDPNKIVFAARFPNLYTNSTTACGTLDIYRGVPSQMAILVNSNDFTGAEWQPYTPNFTVPLGATDGVYNVWIGVRGLSTSSRQTWNWTGLTRDVQPPAIVITSPATNVTAQPMIDLRGYCPERLLHLFYDVANDAGAHNNLHASITDQYFDQNTHAFTTNWFLSPDIELTNGVNTITLRATDLAGNVSTNVFTYTLDLSLGTNPPMLELYWPLDGEVVCGSQFTVRGQLDDPTASVFAQVTDPDGNVTSVKGLVERNGLVWAENLPLAPGTNTVAVTMTNAAGYSSMTNFTVVHSDDVNLTIDDVPADQLSTRLVSVSGTIDSGDYTVWVNGVEATTMIDLEDGTWWWEADGVMLSNGGTATIQAVAIPNSVNSNQGAQNGPLNRGGRGAGMEAPLNNAMPANPQVPDRRAKETNPEQDATVYTKYYHYSLDDTCEGDDWIGERLESHFWTHSGYTNLPAFAPAPLPDSGLLVRTSYSGQDTTVFDWEGVPYSSSWGTSELDYYFPRRYTNWMAFVTLTSTPPPTTSSNWVAAAPPTPPYNVWEEQTPYDAFPAWGVVTGKLDHIERVAVKLRTGGKRLSNRKGFFSIRGWATNFPTPLVTAWSSYAFTAYSTWATEPVVPESIQVLDRLLIGLGMNFPWGLTYRALPDNEEHDITPVVPCQRYTFGLQVLKHKLLLHHHCVIRGDTNRTDLGVGEQVDLSFAPDLITNAFWENTWSTTAGSVSPTNGNQTTFTAQSNGVSATVTAALSGEPLDLPFAVYEPSGYATAIVDSVAWWTPVQAAAGMALTVIMAPTNVSLYRVQVLEVPQDATNAQGWFLIYGAPPHDTNHLAGQWYQLGCDNSWQRNGVPAPDNAVGGVYNPPWYGSGWSGGSFTWHIPVKWKIGGDQEHLLDGWDQKFTLLGDGTVKVQKFDHTVTRHANEYYGTVTSP
jgi:hypothetical protein